MDADGEQSIINQGPIDHQINVGKNVGQIYITINGRQVPLPQWEDLLGRSKANLKRFQGTPERPGPFIPEIYIHRIEAESHFNNFLNSDASALIVIGDSGIGKTNLLGWMSTLQEAGHILFYYNYAGFTRPDVEYAVALDLSPRFPDALPEVLDHIGELAADKGKQFIFIFDAISEFHGDDHTGAESLLKHINTFVEHLPSRNIRIVLSCRTSTWKRLDPETMGLFSYLYFQPTDQETVLRLDLFTPEMLEEAYQRYLQYFKLRTPFNKLSADLRERLRNPLMLRMLAETYRNQTEPIAYSKLALSIFQRFYDSRVSGTKKRQDQDFIDELAAEMIRQRRSTFRVEDLARNERLRSAILSDDADSSYNRLLDKGLLAEISGGPLPGDMVKFTYDQLGGYILAGHLQSMHSSAANTDQIREITRNQITELIRDAQQFSLAWYIAWTLLILSEDTSLFVDLAQSPNVELRELVVQSLVEIHAAEPVRATDIIEKLLQIDSQEAQRTGLKSAYFVNPRVREIFLWAGVKGTPALRQLTRDILYLIWRTDPDFTYGLLHELTMRVKLNSQKDLRNTFEFVLELIVTIYINHCEQEYVAQQTNDIFYELMKDRLHLNWFKTGILGPAVERFLMQRVVNSFSKPIWDTFLFTEVVPAEQFFKLSLEDRACLKQIAPFMDPQTDIERARDVLTTLLKSDIMFFKGIAMVTLAIHAYRSFTLIKPFMRGLFEEQGGQGRLWILLSFAVLLPDTPPEWVALAEEFTRRFIREHPAIFYCEEPSVLTLFDIMLLPLGLAYGKRGKSMPYIETLIGDGLKKGDRRLVERCITGLGIVGFYYPKAVFQVLEPVIPKLDTEALQTALIRTLATIRVLHFDEVDNFLRQVGADEKLQRRVSATTDITLVSRPIQWMGLVNNLIHYSLFFPKMRRRLAIGVLNTLAEAKTAREFLTSYTLEVIHLTQESDFQLKNWRLGD